MEGTGMDVGGEAMAGEVGLGCEILDQDRMKQLGMGSLLGVAMGSAEPPAMIILQYRPEGGAAQTTHLGLVGKGVTFDSGGLSIKPADGMEKMKYDMAGGGGVIWAVGAIAPLKPGGKGIGGGCSAGEMPGGEGVKPGEWGEGMSGKNTSGVDTDGEGRLV